jgi:outer membrane receptor protein involved in Fe transport
VGARHAKESSSFSLLYEGPLDGGTVYTPGRESDTITTPKYGVSYQINDKNMVYASASKGNRLGGANAPFFDLPGCLAELALLGLPAHPGGFNPDYVWNYEIGTKNLLFNDRLQIEASAYHMKWSALQQLIGVNACATQITANIGSANSDGFDLQLNVLATDALRFGAAIGYNNAKIGETVGIPGGITFVNKGDQIDPQHSPWTVTVQAEYNFKIFQTQPAYFRIDDEYHSKNPGPFTFDNKDAPASYNPLQPVNPAQNLLNLRLGTIAHGWDVAAFISNVANSHPILNVTLESSLAPVGHDYTLTPRTVGISGNYRW